MYMYINLMTDMFISWCIWFREVEITKYQTHSSVFNFSAMISLKHFIYQFWIQWKQKSKYSNWACCLSSRSYASKLQTGTALNMVMRKHIHLKQGELSKCIGSSSFGVHPHHPFWSYSRRPLDNTRLGRNDT